MGEVGGSETPLSSHHRVFNPDHADKEGELAKVFVGEVADVLAEKAP